MILLLHNSRTGDLTSRSIPRQSNINPLDYMKDISVTETMFILPTEQKEVLTTALSIKSKSSLGHDNINNILVKNVITSIVTPLTHIFNLSFITGIFPQTYKIAKVIPIFKSGDKYNPNNYRPISLLPAFSKILEKLMYKRLINFICKNDLMYSQQFGFLKGRSTEQAMLDIVYRIVEAIEQKNLSLRIFLDLSKAFDSISHKILISKLSKYGIRGLPRSWLENYLSNRTQFVQTEQASSTLQNITAGVPQGSVLGPLLFLMYVNDMPAISTLMNYILFADDTTGLYSSPTIDELFNTVNNELEKLNDWFAANSLLINVKKTHFVLFMTQQKEPHVFYNSSIHSLSINNKPIELNDYIKFLGLFLDKNIKFSQHIKHICSKLSKDIYALSRASKVFPTKILKTLYFSLILPYLNYDLLVWGGLFKIENPDDITENTNFMRSLTPIHNLQKAP